jgi:hypothetical protein
MALGWLDQVEEVGVVLDESFSLEPVQSGQRILKIPLQTDVPVETMEYLLVEYRTKEGFDADLPASGVLIYHVDPKISGNRPCDGCPQLYRVSLLEADGNNSLLTTFLQGGNRGEAGDAWGVFGEGHLSPNSYPSSSLTSGEGSGVTIHRIALEDGEAKITLSSRELTTQSLLLSFLGNYGRPLTQEEEAYLDRYGNGNGQYDVGDLRAYLRR